MTRDEFLYIAVRELDRREASPPYRHWLLDKNGDDMVGDFCYACAKLELDRILAIDPLSDEDDERRVIHEYPETEDDGCRHCDTCGELLAYTLTNYGVTEELGNFEGAESWDWNNAEDCYHLACIAHGIFENPEQTHALIKVLRKGKNRPATLKSKRAANAQNGVAK